MGAWRTEKDLEGSLVELTRFQPGFFHTSLQSLCYLCTGSPKKKAFVPCSTALPTLHALFYWGGHSANLAESHLQPGGGAGSPQGFIADGVDLREQEVPERERDGKVCI